ncbi:MAG: dockerin type I repeat-containing protein [Ruminococcus sp.]|nr:dockerin type I repeat-containing protein [Ruminococcus sp.]
MRKRSLAAAIAAACFCMQLPVCGTISAAAASGPEFSLGTPNYCTAAEETTDGTESYTIELELSGNKGMQSWVALLDYDSSKVTFDSITSEYFSGIELRDTGKRLIINDFESNDISANGVVAEIKFKLKKGVTPGKYDDCFHLSLSDDPDDFYNYANETLSASVKSATAPLDIRQASNVVITFDNESLNMIVSEQKELKLMFHVTGDETKANLPDNTKWQVKASSTAVSLAAVDGKLVVTANNPGSAVVSATNPEYIDKNGDPITITCTVNIESDQVLDTLSITPDITALKAPEGTAFELELIKNGSVIGTAKISNSDPVVFNDVRVGQYEVRIKCSDKSYAVKTRKIYIDKPELTLQEKLFLYGDLNCDGERDISDLIIMQKIVAGWKVKAPYDELANIDGSEDGKATIDDLVTLQKLVAGWKVGIGGQNT